MSHERLAADRTEVGPVEAVAAGPLQTVAPRTSCGSGSSRCCRRWSGAFAIRDASVCLTGRRCRASCSCCIPGSRGVICRSSSASAAARPATAVSMSGVLDSSLVNCGATPVAHRPVGRWREMPKIRRVWLGVGLAAALISGATVGVARAGDGDRVIAPGSASLRSTFQGVGSGERVVSMDPNGGQFVTVARTDSKARAADDFFGCENNTWPPSFVYQGVIQGPSDFTSCVNLSHSNWTVCLDYGGPLQACSSGTHWYGAGSWTAWSAAYGCPANRPTRSWRTVLTVVHWSLQGNSSYWANSSGYATLNC
ncbi:hypothetical protein Gocc_3110 [Gaiella occulta]|uniref:Uncharacterized protein n=1 Tax=Gaiella occulta TaxID=1002870 RepID=A0A7M2YSU2_9ACTN|nr:hypothetical protein Gocc_3110 [Gaiella occulta]